MAGDGGEGEWQYFDNVKCFRVHFGILITQVVEGTYQMQLDWYAESRLSFSNEKMQVDAQDMYDRIFNMKFLPPGRGLWAMGSPLTSDRRIYASLNNCGFVSTIDIAENPAAPFSFLMDCAMLGIGVGFDTLGSHKIYVMVVYCNQTVIYHESCSCLLFLSVRDDVYIISLIPIMKNSYIISLQYLVPLQ